MPLAISIRDLREIIIQRLIEKLKPETVLIPSEEWIHLQFQPTNLTTERIKQYTGRFDIKFMVQARQLQKDHLNSKYTLLYRTFLIFEEICNFVLIVCFIYLRRR